MNNPKYSADKKIVELENEDHKILVELLEKDELYMELIPKQFLRRDVVEIDGNTPALPGQKFLQQCMSVTNRSKTTIGWMRATIETFRKADPPRPDLEALVTQLDTWINSSDGNYSEQTRIEDLNGQDFNKLEPLMDHAYKEIAQSWNWSARDIKKCSETKSKALTFLEIWNATEEGKLTIGMIIEKARENSKYHYGLFLQLSMWIGQDALNSNVTQSCKKTFGGAQKGAGKSNPTKLEDIPTQHQPCEGARKEQLLEVDQSVLLLLQQLQVTIMCVLHPDCPVEYYCGSHDVNCCQVCASQLHQDCENIDKLDTNCHKFIKEDIEGIKLFLSEVDKMLNKETACISKTKQKAKDFLSKVQIFINAEKEKDSIFQDVQQKVDRSKNKVINVHNDRLSTLQILKKQMYGCLRILESKLSPVQRKIAWKALLNLTQAQVDKSLKTLTSDILEMKMTIHKEFNMTRFDVSTEPKKSEVSEFVSICSDILDTLFIHMSNKPMIQIAREPLIYCDISFLAAAQRSDIQATDKIPDGTYLPDNTILLSDTLNKQLIKLDENLGFLEIFPVAGKPEGVCVSGDGSNVHVICGHNKVVSYTLKGPWREVQRFRTERNARGIACHGDRIVTGHHGYVTYVVIYDSTGTEVSRINTAGASEYPALSHDGRMLYHGDGHNDVVCRSMADVTQEVWRFSSLKFGWPCGIDTDRDGNILIVGKISNNVYQVSGNGKISRILVNKMKFMCSPCGLFSNRYNNTFCVISWDDKECCVEMYRFDD